MNNIFVVGLEDLNPTRMLITGIFRVAADPRPTSNNNLFLTLAYISPVLRREQDRPVMFRVKAWIPLTSELAARLGELRRNDYLLATVVATLRYEQVQTQQERAPTYTTTIYVESMEYAQPVPAERVEPYLRDLFKSRAEDSDQPVANNTPVANSTQPAQSRQPRPPQRPQQQRQSKPVTSPAWSDGLGNEEIIGVDLSAEEDDPFADVDLSQLTHTES